MVKHKISSAKTYLRFWFTRSSFCRLFNVTYVSSICNYMARRGTCSFNPIFHHNYVKVRFKKTIYHPCHRRLAIVRKKNKIWCHRRLTVIISTVNISMKKGFRRSSWKIDEIGWRYQFRGSICNFTELSLTDLNPPRWPRNFPYGLTLHAPFMSFAPYRCERKLMHFVRCIRHDVKWFNKTSVRARIVNYLETWCNSRLPTWIVGSFLSHLDMRVSCKASGTLIKHFSKDNITR